MPRKRNTRNSQAVISIEVAREDYEALKAIASAEYRPMAAEVRMLIEQHIAANGKAA